MSVVTPIFLRALCSEFILPYFIIRTGARVFGALGEPSSYAPPPINFRKLILCISVNKNSVFIISDLIYMIKENNMVLNVHCRCSTLYAKCVLK
jgi:hypothetical protein